MQLTLLRGILIFVGIISILLFPKTVSHATELDLPTQYDWRDHGYDFPVGDQGNCNAGYAFAAVDAVQAAIWKKDSIKLDFSENHAKECNWHALNHYAGLPNTCEGGNFKMLTNLFTQQGLVLETCDPYVDYDTTCNTSCKSQYYITEWQQFSQGYSQATIPLIKQKLIEYGPLYTQMDPKISGFEGYTGGYVLNGTSTDPNNWTHGVLIVGWDDELGSAGAWIVKNSYGTEWGDGGYFAIAYGKAGIGSSLATVTGWERNSEFNKIHFYDEAGHTNQMSVSDTNFYSGSAMGLYPLAPNEILRAVEFWTNDAAIVSFEIYEQFNGIEPVNLLYQSAEIDILYAGYHHIKINEYLEIPENSEIAVVLNVKNESKFFPIMLDHLGPLSFDKTWYRDPGGIWQSLPAWQGQNFEGTIRLRTLSIPEGLNHKVFLPIVSTK
ncbi:MAG: hypothetical protein CVU41_08800 [Chloroflexi bacterium HGW-Chloroflexi-3]|nr:MAG: hypothetical protein CVU41_08800 [Chloroflexi bacterium HGW-Chloroflexi-3]